MDQVEEKRLESEGSPFHLRTASEKGEAPRGGAYADVARENGETASIYWHASTGAHVVVGGIRDAWRKMNAADGFLGYPITDEEDLVGRDGYTIGRISRFEGGTIVWFESDTSTAVYRQDGTLVHGVSDGRARDAALTLVPPTQIDERLNAMGRVLGDLLEVVARQHLELARLSEELSASALLRVQTEVDLHATKHMKDVFDQAKDLLKEGGGEITVGTTTHEGRLKAVRKSDESGSDEETRYSESQNAAAVGLKIKAAILGLGSAKSGFKVDTSQANKALEETASMGRNIRASKVSGQYKITHEALTLVVRPPASTKDR